MPMDSKFTQDLAKLEEYSLALIDFFEKLPNSFFKDDDLQPSEKVVNNIISYSKEKSSPLNKDNRLYRYSFN